MTTKVQKGGLKPPKRVLLHAVSRCLQASTMHLGVLGDLRGPKQAREWLLLSLSELGLEIGKYTGKSFHRSTVSLWELELRTMPAEVLGVYCELVAQKISRLLGRQIEISIEANSPWRVSAYSQCHCGQWFKMHDAKSRNCPRCRRRK